MSDHIPEQDRTQFMERDLDAISERYGDFVRARKPEQVKVQAFNPTQKKDGYISKHTVIMIANDDMPFLVDSTAAELNRMGFDVHLIMHPIVSVIRDDKGEFIAFADKKANPDDYLRESWMYIEIDETPESETIRSVVKNLEAMLQHVRLAVGDWKKMRAKVLETLTELPRNEKAGLPAGEREEAAEFLSWLEADHFTFLGVRDYLVKGSGKSRHLIPHKSSGLGILRDIVSVLFFTDEGEGNQPSDIHHFLDRKQLVLVTKTHKRSDVHRATPMDAILIKRYGENGELIGERLFMGLFTSTAIGSLPKTIPIIRSKIDYVINRAKFDPRSHNGKALIHVLNTCPRDELFQISEEQLFETAMGIVQLHERQRLALFVRHDAFSRFVNCLIYVPRDRFSTRLRKIFQDVLCKAFNGASSEYNVKITDDSLAQIYIVVRTASGQIPQYDKAKLERDLRDASRGWQGHLKYELVAAFGENRGLKLAHRYSEAFPDAYCDSVSATDALIDIAFVEDVTKTGKLSLHLYQPRNAKPGQINLKWFNSGNALSLSQILPIMEDMGLAPDAEYGPYPITPKDTTEQVWVHDCHAHVRDGAKALDLALIKDKFEECLQRTWNGEVESDSFSRLVLLAGLSWREVVILRAVGKYLRQARIPASDATLKATLAAHPQAVRLLVDLFLTRHNPSQQKDAAKKCAVLEKQFIDYLRGVKLAEQDRVLRRYFNVIQNTLRTNYFQTGKDGTPKEWVSFKLDSKKIDDLPLPRPHVEIFVYSPKVEGVHLRGGKVARGGIRWSDRREDFRTEVLGLMKAQVVKNTVIIPVGSKGGFVVKTPNPPDMAKEGVACYQTFIRGLLDITDDRKGEKIIPPSNVVRLDGDDPYLVVAADKGTAKFSDIANAISLDYGFWLGDAFASGGSAGYDHKGMGITARGAWEAVKRHFREMGKDIQKENFTVIGVGDMAGDVFGNGMLLSQHIQLQGAFNHKHIFLDPAPDIAKSFKERQRLFDMSGSQWSDYDKKLISKGGGIYPRDAKTISVSKEVCALYGLGSEDVAPDELIRRMLTAKVDLLWFGGIGTYVKSEEENHNDVGDRANDALRVNAEELRARVIGEGANLGLTQKGRVAFAQNGGHINTDAIDNSAGVDTSDHEVNIKILLDTAIRDGKLNLKARNQLLAKMTADVAKLVLRDNYLQTQALTVAETRAAELLPHHARLISQLERTGLLNRKVEFLPDDDEIHDRLIAGAGLTRPELAVLMGYAKIALYDDLLASSLPDNPGLEGDLFMYFPKLLQDEYPQYIRKHRLRREIIATFTTNSVVNHAGIHFVNYMKNKTGKSAADVTTAYALVRDVYGVRAIRRQVEALDGKIDARTQADLFIRLTRMVERGSEWYLNNANLKNTAAVLAEHSEAVAVIKKWLEKREGSLFSGNDTKDSWVAFQAAGVPEAIIRSVMFLPLLALVPEIITVAKATGHDLDTTADLYFAIEERFNLNTLRKHAHSLPTENHWQREENALLVEDIYKAQAALTQQALTSSGKKKVRIGKDIRAYIQGWIAEREINTADYDKLQADIASAKHPIEAQLSLALRKLLPWTKGKN